MVVVVELVVVGEDVVDVLVLGVVEVLVVVSSVGLVLLLVVVVVVVVDGDS